MQIKLIDYGMTALPTRAHYNDAGLDVWVKNENPEFMDKLNFRPHETKKLPLGFGISLPDGYCAYLMVRSSMAIKGLHVHHPPIDSGFRGEIYVMVTNTTDFAVDYPIQNAIAQLVVTPITYIELRQSHEWEKERGLNGYGSTNTV